MLLTILKYAGLLLATFSSIWGTLNNLTRVKDERKVLTRAGYISIGITVFGLLVAIASIALEDKLRAKQRESALEAEIRRTKRIILSGQPLSSLRVRWTFENVGAEIKEVITLGNKEEMAFHENAQGSVSGKEGNEIHRRETLYPFLSALYRGLTGAKRSSSNRVSAEDLNVLVLLALDEGRNSIVSFGRLGSRVTWGQRRLRSESVLGGDHLLSGGISLCQDYWMVCYLDLPKESSAKLSRTISSVPGLRVKGSSIELFWHLEPQTLSNSLDRRNASVTPTARLPPVLEIAVLGDMDNVPFNTANLSLPIAISFWGAEEQPSEPPVAKVEMGALSSSVELIPNDIVDGKMLYKLAKVLKVSLLDDNLRGISKSVLLLFRFEIAVGST